MANSKRILFVSALDFKKKSIQVIRKTPEAFIQDGWQVDYLVARDNAKRGNYFYEDEINPEGVNVIRHSWRWTWIRNLMPNGVLNTIATKLAAYATTRNLYKKAKNLVKDNHYDVVYGYELHGVLAIAKLRKKRQLSKSKIVNRFQGTWLAMYYLAGNKKKIRLNREAVAALQQPSNLCIMTNDGTQGDLAMNKLGDIESQEKFMFWTNGVDEQKLPVNDIDELIKTYKSKGEFIFLTVSRLESWKRVERSIEIFSQYYSQSDNKNSRLLIVGEGTARDRLESLVNKSLAAEAITFTGGVPHSEVKKYLNLADAFISMYDLSNVGNPLLEAIRCNKIIFTLNNGDTGSWITHRKNGFIYDLNNDLITNAVTDFSEIVSNEGLRTQIIERIQATEKEKLWTWEERMAAEVNEVNSLLDG